MLNSIDSMFTAGWTHGVFCQRGLVVRVNKNEKIDFSDAYLGTPYRCTVVGNLGGGGVLGVLARFFEGGTWGCQKI